MFSQTAHGNSKNQIRQVTEQEGKKREATMEINIAGTKEKSPDDRNYHNQNTIRNNKHNFLVISKI